MGRRGSSKRRRVETPVSLSNTQVSLSSLVSDFSVCKVGISSWTDLPLDIVNLILDKLTEVIDYIRFGSVCKEWYIIFKQYVKPSLNVIPMLFAPSPDPDAPLLYCLTKRYSNLRLLLPYNRRRYIGTSHGWIAIQNWDFTLTLVYPFGKEIHKIPLPPLSHRSWNVDKLIISSDSTLSDYTVVAIYSHPGEFSTIKTGEKSWVRIDLGSRRISCLFTDIIFHQGAVYAIDHRSRIIEVDVHARPPVIKAVHHLLLRENIRKNMQYLVESTSSDLYLLQRFYRCTCNHDRSKTTRFNIFKLNVHGEKGEQFITRPTKSKVPEGDTFFIGDVTTSMAIKSTGCIPNSIYFIDQNCCLPYAKCRYVVANYSTVDGNVRNIYKSNIVDRAGVCQPPIWIVPQLHFAQSEKLLTF